MAGSVAGKFRWQDKSRAVRCGVWGEKLSKISCLERGVAGVYDVPFLVKY